MLTKVLPMLVTGKVQVILISTTMSKLGISQLQTDRNQDSNIFATYEKTEHQQTPHPRLVAMGVTTHLEVQKQKWETSLVCQNHQLMGIIRRPSWRVRARK